MRERKIEEKNMYRPNFYESTCFRCNEIVYQVDRIGPLKDFTFFHTGCFKCKNCGSKLTLKTYFNNQHDHEDKEVSELIMLELKVHLNLCLMVGQLNAQFNFQHKTNLARDLNFNF